MWREQAQVPEFSRIHNITHTPHNQRRRLTFLPNTTPDTPVHCFGEIAVGEVVCGWLHWLKWLATPKYIIQHDSENLLSGCP
jgi:hypothetical protein